MASAVQPNQPDRLTQIFSGLKNKNPDVRIQAADDLARFVCGFMLVKDIKLCR